MILRSTLLILPLLAIAQDAAPPEVDQELRSRVKAFYQNFLDESFAPRKAEPFVAEDTKDFYYNAGKQKYLTVQIGKVTYSDNFTKAVVVVIGKIERKIAGQTVMMDVPNDTHWKIENGKWCWTYNPADYPLTPMGGNNPARAANSDAKGPVIPKNSSPEAMKAAGAELLKQQEMGLNKSNIIFDVDKESSVELVFTNGADGEIQIALDAPVVRGLKVKLDKTTVPGHGTATLTMHFDPSDKSGPKDVWEPKGTIKFRLFAQPFGRLFPLTVQFTPAK